MDDISYNTPSWACERWGQYEHDWLDCLDCLANYDIEINGTDFNATDIIF
jgi:hypothetical protein